MTSAATEAKRDLRLVAFAEEPDQVPELDLIVAFVGSGPELHFLHLDLLQLESRLVLLLRLAVLELAEIHDSANRRLGRRRDLDKIEFRSLCLRQCFRDRHDAELLTFFTNQADLGRGDFAVDPLCSVLGYANSPVSKRETVPPTPRHA